MDWVRVYHELLGDPKLHSIANTKQIPFGHIIAVTVTLLIRASLAKPRGYIDGFNPNANDSFLGYPKGTSQSIFNAMQEEGIHDGKYLINWLKRNPVNVDTTNAERQARHRANKKNKPNN